MTTLPPENTTVDSLMLRAPLALINGEPLVDVPDDLYIPPEALEIFLDMFSGPLDLLLYLIRRQNLDVLNIPITEITRQYMTYIELMHEMRLDLAAEYLLMAAMLAEIKSRMLLPSPAVEAEANEEDPRAELVRRLQEYERFKNAAEGLDRLARLERDLFEVNPIVPPLRIETPRPTVSFAELMRALQAVMVRASRNVSHQVKLEPLSVRERMTSILSRLQQAETLRFEELFILQEGRRGVVVTFIALLELVKQSMIELRQEESFSPIEVFVRGKQHAA